MIDHLPGWKAPARRLVAATVLLSVCAVPSAAPARSKPTPCAAGQFIVDAADRPLLPSGGTEPDLIALTPDALLVAGCVPDHTSIHARRHFTAVTARFARCGGLEKVPVTAKIPAPDCSVLQGHLKAKHTPGKAFGATRAATVTSTTVVGTTTTSTTIAPCNYDAPNACASAAMLSAIDGDQNADTSAASGSTSKWFQVLVHEGSSLQMPLSFTASVTSPAGMHFDLFVYEGDGNAPDCFATPVQGTGNPATVHDSWPDAIGTDDSRWVTLEVRYVTGTACGAAAQWDLAIAGNTTQ